MYFYTDTPLRDKDSQINVWKMNGTKAYMRHYDNKLFLRFVANNKRSTLKEKLQAEHELKICERKLDFWHKHPNTDHDQLRGLIEKANREWSAPA